MCRAALVKKQIHSSNQRRQTCLSAAALLQKNAMADCPRADNNVGEPEQRNAAVADMPVEPVVATLGLQLV